MQYDARYTQRHINTLQYDARYTQRHVNTLQYGARYTQLQTKYRSYFLSVSAPPNILHQPLIEFHTTMTTFYAYHTVLFVSYHTNPPLLNTFNHYNYYQHNSNSSKCIALPVPLAALSKAWVCGRSPAEIAGSNPWGGTDVLSVM